MEDKEYKKLAATEQTGAEKYPTYTFNESPDGLGVALEAANYAKPSCNQCLGRGYVIHFKHKTAKTPESRTASACSCVVKKYAKLRAEAERRRDKIESEAKPTIG